MRYSTVLAAIAFVALGSPVAAQHGFEMDREDELRLAMSAGPLEVSQDADVYVFGARGFEKALDGTNGFSCLVIRVAGEPEALAPHCLSPDATASVLPAKLAEGRMIAAGLSREVVAERLLRDFDSGALPIPAGHSYAYMLSSGQNLGPAGQWMPHFMLYMPGATNEDVGGVPGAPAFPFVGPEIGHPHSTMVVVMTEFVDPADVKRRW